MQRYKMSRIERAKQFAPFDALTGLGRAIKAKEEEYTKAAHHELSDDEAAEINAVLLVLAVGDIVRVNYFCEGAFFDVIGSVIKVEEARKILYIDVDDELQLDIPFIDIKSIARM